MDTVFKISTKDMQIITQKVANTVQPMLIFQVHALAPDWGTSEFIFCVRNAEAKRIAPDTPGLRYTIDWYVDIIEEGYENTHSIIIGERFVADIHSVRVTMGSLNDATAYRNAIALELASRISSTVLRTIDFSFENRVSPDAMYIQIDNHGLDASGVEGFIA